MPKLNILAGSNAGTQYTFLDEDEVVIGRDHACQLQIADPKASRMHAKVVGTAQGYEVVDLNSSNGTWVGEERIERHPLEHGTVFAIGSTCIRLELERVEESDPTWGDTVTGLEDGETILLEHVDQPQDQLARINHYLALLHQVVLRTHEATTRDGLFDILDDIAAEGLEGDRCAVFLPSPDGWGLWPPHERRLRARFGVTPFARSLLEMVAAQKRALLCTSEGDVDPSLSMVQAGVSSAMGAPLRIGDEIQALLYVDRLGSETPFSREDLEFLAAIANQLAVRMHNFDTVRELEAEVFRLSQDKSTVAIDLVGQDPTIDSVRAFIAKAAPTEAPVLIMGESGTGKELVARALHLHSQRSGKPRQVVNCAALAESLVESTLFGHVKGAFTGADDNRPGLFELADQGTLFLDEIGELPQQAQSKLLRAIEQGETQRLGENLVRKVDVRVIAATNRDLEEEITAGRFREDLYHRLDVLTVTLPPLRERPADLELLINHFRAEFAARLDTPVKKLSAEARTILMRYTWPGNVRQLRNVLERASIMATGKVIQAEDLPESLHENQAVTVETPMVSLAEVERVHILRVLEHCGGNKKATAELLGIDRSTLYAKLRQYKL